VDFTALGDSVNTAARLASCAKAGEIVIGSAAATASKLETDGLEERTLNLRGRAESVPAWVITPGGAVDHAASAGVG
jgi:adenylate cyclase